MKSRLVRFFILPFAVAFLVFAPLNTSAAPFLSATSEPAAEQGVRGAFRALIKAWDDLQTLRQQLTTKQVNLNFEKNFDFPSLKEISRIDEQIEKRQTLLKEGELTPEKISVIKEEIQALQQEKIPFQKTYETRQEKQQKNIVILEEEIEDIQEGIERQRQLIQAQISKVLENVAFFLSIILLLILARFGFGKIISRLQLHDQRKHALLGLNRAIFNIIIGIFVIGIIFSQFVNFLPFLALLGTGLAFAVRDSISSFIGWFAIGTDRGYRIGDIIRVGESHGEVREVGPFVTVLYELLDGEKTGKLISFPNKFIFEDAIVNFSRCYRLIQEYLSFPLSAESDIEKAKTMLKKIIQQKNKKSDEFVKNINTKLQRNYHFTENEQKIRIWVDIENNQLQLRARYLVDLDQKEEVRTDIVESFLNLVDKEKQINLLAQEKTLFSAGKAKKINPEDMHH
ncbi:mechanosensitive ion channel [Candidatus Gracilibacteria bacterium]|nr:mechanosensitive ion channel [Candidatus Gracilibacteria bacterium]MCF7819552.1 mechanosensitive ion channel [Candidatus Gracilibacteria bacterium]